MKKINPFANNKRYAWNDKGMSNLFADCFKDICRFVPQSKLWFVYDGTKWVKDECGLSVSQLCKDFSDYLIDCHHHLKDDEKRREAWIKFAAKSSAKKFRDTVISDAKSVYPIDISTFDKDPYIINLLNCTLNMKTMRRHKHKPSDYLSKIANVNFVPDATCERWVQFMCEIMQDDAEKSLFLQKALGLSLTGVTDYECFFILHGEKTRNGKGTTMETMLALLGDYGVQAKPDMIAQKFRPNSSGPSEEIARLHGKRFVNVSEPSKGLKLDEALIKSLTGNDTINARFLNENSFDFKPVFKLFINTNPLPKISDDTIFTSGRVMRIPFERHFPENEQDIGLKTLFRQPESLSGILNWLIGGWKAIQESGFSPPDVVRSATAEYRDESDTIGNFIKECLLEYQNKSTPLKVVYSAYSTWCLEYGHTELKSKSFSQELRRKGVKIEAGTGNRAYIFDYVISLDA